MERGRGALLSSAAPEPSTLPSPLAARAGPPGTLRWLVPPAAVLAGAVAFTLWLVSHTHAGVFFSGDAGLKYLLAEQAARGRLALGLQLDAPAWIQRLWTEGLYPFHEPFVYVVGREHLLQYPPYFSFLTAPFLRAFGDAGLYVAPVAALWATWVGVLVACRALLLPAALAAAVLFAVAFCTPLTLYAAIYWEHTLGVALATWGVWALVLWGDRPRVAAAAGVLLGMSAWFRSESLLLVIAAVALVAILSHLVALERSSRMAFAVGACAAVGALLVVNLVLFGAPLGLHARALTASGPAEWLASVAQESWRVDVVLLISHFPSIIPIAAVAVASARIDEPPRARAQKWVLAVCAAFALGLPFILPPARLSGYGGKQWGPRFLLAIIPLACVSAAALVRSAWPRWQRPLRVAVAGASIATAAYGVYLNTIVGSALLVADYEARVRPALQLIQARPQVPVAVANQFIAQELVAAMGRNPFVLARDARELGRVARASLDAGAPAFLLLTDAPVTLEGARPIAPGAVPAFLRTRAVGTFGAYVVHEASVVPAAP